MVKSFVLFLSFVFMGNIFAMQSFLPENKMYIPVSEKSTSMTEKTFNDVLDEFEKVYAPVFTAKGKVLVVHRNWTDGTVNAYAYQEGNNWHVAMFGGLARHAAVTEDGLLLVACHEAGHHLAGTPRRSWAAVEGQSDYFGSAKCLKRVMESRESVVVPKALSADDKLAKTKCDSVYSDHRERSVCLASALAGKGLSAVFVSSVKPQFGTPDLSAVSATNSAHPAGQCRLDTYFQGALCDKAYDEDFDMYDQKIGACNQGEYALGVRPRCWFKP